MISDIIPNPTLTAVNRSTTKIPEDVKDPELYKACQGFEAYFVRHLVGKMRGSMNLMGTQNAGSEIYQGMFDNALGEEITNNGSVGIARMLYRQITEGKGITPVKSDGFNPAGPVEKRIDSFNKIISKAAKKYGVDNELIRAVISNESGGMPRAVSPKGAKGLMQLMDTTAHYLGVKDSFDVEQNIDGGVRYLLEQIKEFNDLEKALAAYNAGPERVRAVSGIPDIIETRQYVTKVLRDYENYKVSRDNNQSKVP